MVGENIIGLGKVIISGQEDVRLEQQQWVLNNGLKGIIRPERRLTFK